MIVGIRAWLQYRVSESKGSMSGSMEEVCGRDLDPPAKRSGKKDKSRDALTSLDGCQGARQLLVAHGEIH